MRGEVIDYAAGEGLISGEDGHRYSFRDDDIVRRDGPIRAGVKVDFVPEADRATQIYLLAGSTRFETTNEDLTVWGYFVKCMRLYANGDGRARRKEYWSFVLFSAIIAAAAVMIIVFPLVAIAIASREAGGDVGVVSPAHWLIIVVVLALLFAFAIPSYAVLARRLHDIGMSGWFALFSLVPYVGGLFVLVVALIPSQEQVNAYGPYPKPRAPYAI